MPFAGYKDFDACVRANQDKDDPNAYCGSIQNQVEGSGKYEYKGRSVETSPDSEGTWNVKIDGQLQKDAWDSEVEADMYAKSVIDSGIATKEISSMEVANGSLDDWYNRQSPAKKAEADQSAMDMFRKKFLDLDDEDQHHTMRGLGNSKAYFSSKEETAEQFLERAAREYSDRQPLQTILQSAGNFDTFKTEALRQGYSEAEIEKYLNDINADSENEMFSPASKEVSGNAAVHDSNYDPEWDVNYESIGGGRFRISVNGQDLGEANSLFEAKSIVRDYMDDQSHKHGDPDTGK